METNTANNVANNTYNRVAEWNKRGGKLAPDQDNTNAKEFFEILLKQAERIEEETKETIKAVGEKDRLEILDGICDVDVTISGLLYLAGVDVDAYLDGDVVDYPDDVFTEAEFLYALNDVLDCIGIINSFDLHNMNAKVTSKDVVGLIALELEELYFINLYLTEYANRNFLYKEAIEAVLDNNDAKFYSSDYCDLAFDRARELSESGDEHIVVLTIDAGEEEIDVDDLSFDDLCKYDAVYSIHRKFDDKIQKPKDFVGVDLSEYI